jgi:hypothetical protein
MVEEMKSRWNRVARRLASKLSLALGALEKMLNLAADVVASMRDEVDAIIVDAWIEGTA